jgi:hypothetical protein
MLRAGSHTITANIECCHCISNSAVRPHHPEEAIVCTKLYVSCNNEYEDALYGVWRVRYRNEDAGSGTCELHLF